MSEFNFSFPEAFLLTLLIPLFVFLFYKRQNIRAIPFSGIFSLKNFYQTSLRVFFKNSPFYLKLLSFFLIIFALAGPRMTSTKAFNHVEGIHIMLVLDISQSMMIEDINPLNRLQAAKEVMKDFIKSRLSDRMGLIVFSGESYTGTPLTLDHKVLLESLDRVKTDLDIEQGTAIGLALAHGVARLKDSNAKSKIMILLTDGDNNAGEVSPETALDIAKEYEIKVYTIGLGKNGVARVPLLVKDPVSGQIRRVYQQMRSFVNVNLLKKIALETNGKFFRVVDELKLKSVFKEIDDLEKTKMKAKEYLEHKELFENFLKIALSLLFMSWLLSATVLKVKP